MVSEEETVFVSQGFYNKLGPTAGFKTRELFLSQVRRSKASGAMLSLKSLREESFLAPGVRC